MKNRSNLLHIIFNIFCNAIICKYYNFLHKIYEYRRNLHCNIRRRNILTFLVCRKFEIEISWVAIHGFYIHHPVSQSKLSEIFFHIICYLVLFMNEKVISYFPLYNISHLLNSFYN